MVNVAPKPFVFVLMPFAEEFKKIYQEGIKPACTSAGAYCERVDEQIFLEDILERVYAQIAKADIIVAEMTGRNANVFYETGYAHALNKKVVLLTQKASDIPFDLKHYPHVIYNGDLVLLKVELKSRIRWCIENPNVLMSGTEMPHIAGYWHSYHSLNRNAKPVGKVIFQQRGVMVEGDITALRSRDGSKTNKQFKLQGKFVAGQLAFIYEDTKLQGYVIGSGVLKLSGDNREFVGKITYFHQDRNSLEVFDLRLARVEKEHFDRI